MTLSRSHAPARALLLVLACAAGLSCAKPFFPVDRVATRDLRVIDPDYTGMHRDIGEQALAERDYRGAWGEYAALGDFSALRTVMTRYIADVERFDAALFASMLEEYGEGYMLQFNDKRPLDHLREPLTKATTDHAGSSDPTRLRIAFDARMSYLRLLRTVGQRRAYLPQVRSLGDKASDPLAAEITSTLDEFEADHVGALTDS